MIPSLIHKAWLARNNNSTLEVWGSPETTRDFMCVDDAARAIVALMMSDADGVFNISTGIERSIGSVVDLISSYYNCAHRVIWLSDAPVGISRRFVSNDKLSRCVDLSISPFDYSLRDVCAWFDHVMNNSAKNNCPIRLGVNRSSG